MFMSVYGKPVQVCSMLSWKMRGNSITILKNNIHILQYFPLMFFRVNNSFCTKVKMALLSVTGGKGICIWLFAIYNGQGSLIMPTVQKTRLWVVTLSWYTLVIELNKWSVKRLFRHQVHSNPYSLGHVESLDKARNYTPFVYNFFFSHMLLWLGMQTWLIESNLDLIL